MHYVPYCIIRYLFLSYITGDIIFRSKIEIGHTLGKPRYGDGKKLELSERFLTRNNTVTSYGLETHIGGT